MNSNIRRQLILAAFLVSFLGTTAIADSGAIQEKLKREVKVALDDVTIVEALEQIGEKAGLAIELSEEAIWELPEGTETRLSVTLEGQLDQSLEEMLNAFFMRYAVGSDAVVIYPRPELKHIMGRPTAQTLELLRNIYTNRMYLKGESKVIEKLSPSFISQMAGGDVSISPLEMSRHVGKVMGQLADASQEKVLVLLAPVLDEVTESVSRGRDRWVVSSPEFPSQVPQIKFVSRDELLTDGVNRLVDISYEEATGLMILRDLAATGDFELRFAEYDRAWLERKISIEALNMAVHEALARVTGALGGEGTMTGDGVYVVTKKKPPQTGASRARAEATARARAAAAARARAAAASRSTAASVASTARSGDYVGKISIPMDGGRYFIEFMLRESDLTDELRQLRAERIKAILEAKPVSDPVEETPTP
ncbi:MAG: hypothetical protein ACYTAS_09185 [Planctomycetota bacterium]